MKNTIQSRQNKQAAKLYFSRKVSNQKSLDLNKNNVTSSPSVKH